MKKQYMCNKKYMEFIDFLRSIGGEELSQMKDIKVAAAAAKHLQHPVTHKHVYKARHDGMVEGWNRAHAARSASKRWEELEQRVAALEQRLGLRLQSVINA